MGKATLSGLAALFEIAWCCIDFTRTDNSPTVTESFDSSRTVTASFDAVSLRDSESSAAAGLSLHLVSAVSSFIQAGFLFSVLACPAEFRFLVSVSTGKSEQLASLRGLHEGRIEFAHVNFWNHGAKI